MTWPPEHHPDSTDDQNQVQQPADSIENTRAVFDASEPPADEQAERLSSTGETDVPATNSQSDPISAFSSDYVEPPIFHDIFEPDKVYPERIPHLGHVGVLILLSLSGLFCTSVVARLALRFHLFGIQSVTQALTDIHYTLGSEGIFYVITFAFSLVVFPLLWHKSLLAGLHWRGDVALRRRGRLISAALLCFLLALLDGWIMPGPSNSPIDRIFRLPGAAWMLFGFGVTLAPFFEEMGFRGFLLPSLCTAFDWAGEKIMHTLPRPLDEHGHPQWSFPAMAAATLLSSMPFALMHADQTGYAIGPFLLLFAVSIVLSAVRLATRSLASCVLVHACYNFFLFALMFFGTNGFRHLENF
ncbi:MAG TPA: CPBP family intramembrane glutamic endopeptidase [Terracidiphilus sp.]|nr:CPBP family intramembrane glutamic endopeptidase [Terracidiphilus sp.]